ncbi:MAG: hypothetical protein ACK5PS_18110 [Desulfopila sp.]
MPIQSGFVVDMSITGQSYTKEYALLSSALLVLKGYQESFGQCLRISAKNFGTEDEQIPTPRIGLVSTDLGSLDIKTMMDITAIALPLVPSIPDMLRYSVELYKAASDLVKVATKHFSQTQQPITVNTHIENSPGACVTPAIIVVGNHGNVTINDPNVYTAAKLIHRNLNNMAEQIGSGDVDTLKISATGTEEQQNITAISMTEANKHDYKVLSKKTSPDRTFTAKCDIYGFNRKSGNGSLDIIEESAKKFYPFVGVELDHDLFIEALSAHYSIITFTSTMEINALGESKICKIFIHDISNHYDDPAGGSEPPSVPGTPQGGANSTLPPLHGGEIATA